jgi:hypothetical protein
MLPLVRRNEKRGFAVPSRSSSALSQVDDETIPGGLSRVQLQAGTMEEDSDEQHRSRQ